MSGQVGYVCTSCLSAALKNANGERNSLPCDYCGKGNSYGTDIPERVCSSCLEKAIESANRTWGNESKPIA